MNNDSCPFLTGNERMELVISNAQLTELLRLQFENKADHPYLHIEEEKPKEDGRRKSTTTPGGSANDLTNYFLDDLKCMVC